MKMNEAQFQRILHQLRRLNAISGFYSEKLADIDLNSIRSQEDFEKIPFTCKRDLRKAYPLGLMAAPEEKIVRIHSSSGTTGTPVIIPYTRNDIEDWAIMFERCYQMAGLTPMDRVHITPGYGLWTAGIGFQAGAERLGAMVIPMGPGNTEKQLKIMQDMKSTVLCATSSYALLLAEEIARHGIRDKIHLKKGIIGSERWGEKMRRRISEELGIELYDIYGLTEIYGPGIGINCIHNAGMHIWDDYLYCEIIHPESGKPVPDGEVGELVITTLVKEGAPLIRYRTHDLTRFIPGECACGSPYPRIDAIIGRTDDMVKIRGVNIFPGQIDDMLKGVPCASSEYQFHIEHISGRDECRLLVEVNPGSSFENAAEEIGRAFKANIGISVTAVPVKLGELPRSEKKTVRIFDKRC